MKLRVLNFGKSRLRIARRGEGKEVDRAGTVSIEPDGSGSYDDPVPTAVLESVTIDDAISVELVNEGDNPLTVSEEGDEQYHDLAAPVTLEPGERREYEGLAGVTAVVKEVPAIPSRLPKKKDEDQLGDLEE